MFLTMFITKARITLTKNASAVTSAHRIPRQGWTMLMKKTVLKTIIRICFTVDL